MRAFWATVEVKVQKAAIGALIASLIAAIINAFLNGSPIPQTPHAWVQFLIITIGPPVVAFVRGYAARHTPVLRPTAAKHTADGPKL